jgi:hypothetical protein
LRRAATPLTWYYGVTLAVPLANGALRTGDAFLEHAVVVLVAPLVLVATACMVCELWRVLRLR